MATESTYYEKGSTQPAAVTATVQRALDQRQTFTNHDSIVIALVGLPGRGKSFIARKIQNYLNWCGVQCKTFNVGKYRRESDIATDDASFSDTKGADFFDSKNEDANKLREEMARLALRDMLKWVDGVDDKNENGRGSYLKKKTVMKVAIFDATNSTHARRQMIVEECSSYEKRGEKMTKVVFVESICDNQELLEENFCFKVANSPDFHCMSKEEAIADLKRRVKNYEDRYETVDEDHYSYIKVFNLSSKIMANQIYGTMSSKVVPSLMAWNIGHRPIFLCRSGEAGHAKSEKITVEKPNRSSLIERKNIYLSRRKVSLASDLDQAGEIFRDALSNFIKEEGTKFMQTKQQNENRRRMSHIDPMLGTSIGGTAAPFPLKIFCSTLPSSISTVTWVDLPYHVDVNSNLNPLNKGDFRGMKMEEIAEKHPEWYAQFEKDPYNTRFPGGECYADLISRINPCLMEMEQQVIPVLVVTHLSCIQVLLAYFLGTPVEECTSIAVPENTVIKLTPSSGGTWMENRHQLL